MLAPYSGWVIFLLTDKVCIFGTVLLLHLTRNVFTLEVIDILHQLIPRKITLHPLCPPCMSRHTSGIYLPLELGAMLDLLQVDLLASGASLVWPQATKSGEVDLSRLMGFPFAFRVKNGEWRDLHLGFQVSFASPCLQWRDVQIPLQLNLLNMCVYLHHRRSKFVYFVRKLSLTMILGES